MLDDSQDAYQQVQQCENTGSFSHELIGGAAAFGAMKIFEDRQRREGKPVSHQFAKEMLAGIVGGEVDKFAETKGEDMWDREEAKRHARTNAEHLYEEHYERGYGADQYDP